MLKICLIGFHVFATMIFLVGAGMGLTGVTMQHISSTNSANHVAEAQASRLSELKDVVAFVTEAEQQDAVNLSLIQEGSEV